MDLAISQRDIIIFDLDDTLYKEIGYLKSAYRVIADTIAEEIGINIYAEMFKYFENGQSTFDVIKERYPISLPMSEILNLYRYHSPNIQLEPGVLDVLNHLKNNDIPIGLITDGRGRSQRNKLVALGIEEYFSNIIISEEFGSEKPSSNNFEYYENMYSNSRFTYIGDNISKDFYAPNLLGWRTICINDDGRNIHSQNLDVDCDYIPMYRINSFMNMNFKL